MVNKIIPKMVSGVNYLVFRSNYRLINFNNHSTYTFAKYGIMLLINSNLYKN